jgi:tetratricopeptide (TPR) repeat protein
LLAVAAANADGTLAQYSGRGDILAPGSVYLIPEWRYHYDDAQRLARTGRHAQARALYERSLAVEANGESEYQIGVLELNANQVDEGIARFRRAIQLRPDLAEAHAMLGAAFILKGDFPHAQRALRESLDLYPDRPELSDFRAQAHFNLGLALTLLGRYDEAKESYQAVQQIARDYQGLDKAIADMEQRRLSHGK